jgi:hypothetical protein
METGINIDTEIRGTALNDLPESNELKSPVDPLKILESCKVNPLVEIPAPPVVIEILNPGRSSSPSFTLGNFSLLIGNGKNGQIDHLPTEQIDHPFDGLN